MKINKNEKSEICSESCFTSCVSLPLHSRQKSDVRKQTSPYNISQNQDCMFVSDKSENHLS